MKFCLKYDTYYSLDKYMYSSITYNKPLPTVFFPVPSCPLLDPLYHAASDLSFVYPLYTILKTHPYKCATKLIPKKINFILSIQVILYCVYYTHCDSYYIFL